MCNRIRSIKDWSQTPRELAGALINFEFNPNVAPTEFVPGFLSGIQPEPIMRLVRFGISSRKALELGRNLILNTRMETARTGYYDWMLLKQRCIIPANGFYEFRKEEGLMQPYYFYRKDGKAILFAGLWDYTEIDGSDVPSFSIMTSEPNALIAPYHDRMPVVVDDPMPWLDAGDRPLDAIVPLDLDMFGVRPVNPAVNSPREKDLSKIESPIAKVTQGSLF